MSESTCRRNCWLIAAGCGALLAVVLIAVAKFAVIQALLTGLIVAASLGLLFGWAFCTGTGIETVPAPRSEPAPRVEERPTETKPVAHALDWQVTDANANQRKAIFGGTAELPPREGRLAENSAPAPEPDPPATVAAAAPVTAAAKPRAAKPKAVAQPAAEAKAPAKKAPRAAGIDAAMGRTHEEAAPAKADTLLLLAPRDGKADDLKLVVGIGPALERLLNEVGVWHFDQIAGWKAKDIAFVDSKLKTFKGRITRDGWVKQARALARDAAKAK